MAQILHKITDEVLFEDKGKSIRELALANSANLRYADLSNANLRYANLSNADLSNANLRYANLSNADLRYADLRYADLRYADLSNADLSNADLSNANLCNANLSNADLSNANLSNANLSNAKNLKHAADFLCQFKQDELGLLVYKRIGNGKTTYPLRSDWKIKRNAILTENPNPTKTQECGCGVNFGTLEWCKKNYEYADLWLCRIAWIDLADVIVSYETDGKARCAKLTLLKKVKV